MHYSSLFQYFFWSTMVVNLLQYLYINFFGTLIMIMIEINTGADLGGLKGSIEPILFWHTLNITW